MELVQYYIHWRTVVLNLRVIITQAVSFLMHSFYADSTTSYFCKVSAIQFGFCCSCRVHTEKFGLSHQ
jgi:hypothetical protein